ncbi:hypothetical protein AMTR_s00002p00270200 [Amborella trichopoda]|uniref:Uncharacterized protein n=1 Tax=Amborella trichopoda TaxID=13333 RepID=W1P1P5_AMBTC|nr:hypothetical protein AMTR_s00002p00270200 [Amborella trichopoda]
MGRTIIENEIITVSFDIANNRVGAGNVGGRRGRQIYRCQCQCWRQELLESVVLPMAVIELVIGALAISEPNGHMTIDIVFPLMEKDVLNTHK